MVQLFLIYSDHDCDCAIQLQSDLSERGYTIWQDTSGAALNSTSAFRAWQQGMQKSRVVVVVWSAAAAQAASVAQRLDYAHQLHQRVVMIALDSTAPPDTLSNAKMVNSTAPCSDAATQLLMHLPTTGTGNSVDELLKQLLAKSVSPSVDNSDSDNSPHIFRVVCANHHVTCFDKRKVCSHNSSIMRSDDKLLLPCGEAGCGERMVVEVDCRGY